MAVDEAKADADAATLARGQFLNAVVHGRVDDVRAGLEAGQDPQACILAVRNGRVACLAALLAAGAVVDAQDKLVGGMTAGSNKLTPLQHVASLCYRYEDEALARLVSMLVGAGCDVNVRHPITGHTPLYLAARYDRVEVVKELLRGGAVIPRQLTCEHAVPFQSSTGPGYTTGRDYGYGALDLLLFVAQGGVYDASNVRRVVHFHRDPARVLSLLVKTVLIRRLPLVMLEVIVAFSSPLTDRDIGIDAAWKRWLARQPDTDAWGSDASREV